MRRALRSRSTINSVASSSALPCAGVSAVSTMMPFRFSINTCAA
jgi:hypothetical protein